MFRSRAHQALYPWMLPILAPILDASHSPVCPTRRPGAFSQERKPGREDQEASTNLSEPEPISESEPESEPPTRIRAALCPPPTKAEQQSRLPHLSRSSLPSQRIHDSESLATNVLSVDASYSPSYSRASYSRIRSLDAPDSPHPAHFDSLD